MPNTTPDGITYPASGDHTRLWEHLQTLAETVQAALTAKAGVKAAKGTVVVSDGGSAPSVVAVTFPVGRFTAAPDVQLTARTGAGASTISNLSVSDITTGGCNVSINRNTTTNVTVGWLAMQV